MESCVLGTTMHAYSGIFAAQDYSTISVCAEEIIRYLPDAVFHLKEVAERAAARDAAASNGKR